MPQSTSTNIDHHTTVRQIKLWGKELGFDEVKIADIDLAKHEDYLNKWLDQGMHGEMDYMQRHGTKRSRPQELIPGTQRVISVRLDYFPPIEDSEAVLEQSEVAYISRYALGRDYHKLMRNRLKETS